MTNSRSHIHIFKHEVNKILDAAKNMNIHMKREAIMAFSLFFSLTLILLIAFCSTKRRNLTLFEILFAWMVFIFIHHPLLTIIALNLHLITFPTEMANYWTLVFIRITLIPLLIIWFLDFWITASVWLKAILFPLGVVLLIGLEYLGDLMGLWRHTHWTLWWSVVEWSVLLQVVYLTLLGFRIIFMQELRNRNEKRH